MKKKNTKGKNKKKVVKKKLSKKKEQPKEKRKLWKVILTAFITLCIIGIVSVALFLLYIIITTEEFDPAALSNREQTVVYDKDGNIIDTLGEEKRENVTYEELPEVFVCANDSNAFILLNALTLMNIKVPDQIAITGFDDTPLCDKTIPKLKNIILAHEKEFRMDDEEIILGQSGNFVITPNSVDFLRLYASKSSSFKRQDPYGPSTLTRSLTV